MFNTYIYTKNFQHVEWTEEQKRTGPTRNIIFSSLLHWEKTDSNVCNGVIERWRRRFHGFLQKELGLIIQLHCRVNANDWQSSSATFLPYEYLIINPQFSCKTIPPLHTAQFFFIFYYLFVFSICFFLVMLSFSHTFLELEKHRLSHLEAIYMNQSISCMFL